MQELREKLNIGIPQEILELERRLEAFLPVLGRTSNGLRAMHELRVCLRPGWQFLEECADE